MIVNDKKQATEVESIETAELDEVVGGCSCGCGMPSCNCSNGSCGGGTAAAQPASSYRMPFNFPLR